MKLDLENRPYHLISIDDIKNHEDSVYCRCKPKFEEENNTLVIIHNTFDESE